MDAALDLNFDQDSMYSYSPDQNPSSALPHQPSRLSRHEIDEIFRLTDFLTRIELNLDVSSLSISFNAFSMARNPKWPCGTS